MVKILLKNSPAYLGKITPAPVENQTFFTNPVEDLSDTISRTQLSQDSIEFNEFVREFWAGGFYSEAFGDHIPEQP